jgi:hypothetical protein
MLSKHLDLFKAANSTRNQMDEVGVNKGGVPFVVMPDLEGKMGKMTKSGARVIVKVLWEPQLQNEMTRVCVPEANYISATDVTASTSFSATRQSCQHAKVCAEGHQQAHVLAQDQPATNELEHRAPTVHKTVIVDLDSLRVL